ncbi:hypothetical protein XENTR_v10017332 [Xenopus tropicalis]|nr:hypothetical protein XENTR_v10017332 [Xenopus tropicalis]
MDKFSGDFFHQVEPVGIFLGQKLVKNVTKYRHLLIKAHYFRHPIVFDICLYIDFVFTTNCLNCCSYHQ